MIDLDGTLVDRDSAFRCAVGRFAEETGIGPDAVPWIMELDKSGYAPRADVAGAMLDRYPSLRRVDCENFLADGGCEDVALDAAVATALKRLRSSGFSIVIVTNGPTVQQERKIFHTGLDALVDGWVVSESEGVKKPNAQMFRLAAARVDGQLEGAWMIGDNIESDIRGAFDVGCRTAWVSGGASWPHSDFRPSRIDVDAADALLGID